MKFSSGDSGGPKIAAGMLAGVLLLGGTSMAAGKSRHRTEIAAGAGLGSAFIRVGRQVSALGWGVRFFETSSLFSEHLDDHREFGVLGSLSFPPRSRSFFVRLGAGLALCLVETGHNIRTPAIGLPLELELGSHLGRRLSLGVFAGVTLNRLKGYGGFGLTASLLL